MENYIKQEKELRTYFCKKYTHCNSTLEKLLIDVDYNSAKNRLWDKFVIAFNK